MNKEVFKDSTQPIGARVKDLMGRMSLAEKANQLTCFLGFGSLDTSKVNDGIGEVAFTPLGCWQSAKVGRF